MLLHLLSVLEQHLVGQTSGPCGISSEIKVEGTGHFCGQKIEKLWPVV
jgi:hypothetical protein